MEPAAVAVSQDINSMLQSKLLTHTEDGVPIRKLYVGSLPKKVRTSTIRSLFEKYGDVEDICILPVGDKQSYAFVTFAHTEDAVKALADKRNVTHSCHKLRIFPADTWHQPDSSSWLSDRCNQDHVSSESQENEDNDTSCLKPIDKLNDDCLLHILSMLTLKERIAVERVSKRWQSLSLYLWSNQRTLRIEDFSCGSWDFILTTQKLRTLLIRCTKSLTSLDLSHKACNLNIRTFQIIAKHCPLIEYLNASGLTITLHGAKALAQNCVRIKELYMEHCSGLTDEELRPIFSQNKSLQVVNISRNSRVMGICLHYLPGDILNLNLMQCNDLEGSQLTQNLVRFKKLSTLNLDSCVTLRNYTVRDIMTHTTQLTDLTLSSYIPLLTPDGLTQINSMVNLVNLNLRFSHSVNDDTLRRISTGCRLLEQLDISCTCSNTDFGNSELSNEGVGALGNLPELHTLKMSYLMVGNLCLELLADASKLTSLECRGCPNISDRGCRAVLESCHLLTDFDVSGCMSVSDSTISTSIVQMELRTSLIPLVLHIGGTLAEHRNVPETKPALLKIDFTDWSIKHLKPAYTDDFLGDNNIEYFDEESLPSNDDLEVCLENIENVDDFEDLEIFQDIEHVDDFEDLEIFQNIEHCENEMDKYMFWDC